MSLSPPVTAKDAGEGKENLVSVEDRRVRRTRVSDTNHIDTVDKASTRPKPKVPSTPPPKAAEEEPSAKVFVTLAGAVVQENGPIPHGKDSSHPNLGTDNDIPGSKVQFAPNRTKESPSTSETTSTATTHDTSTSSRAITVTPSSKQEDRTISDSSDDRQPVSTESSLSTSLDSELTQEFSCAASEPSRASSSASSRSSNSLSNSIEATSSSPDTPSEAVPEPPLASPPPLTPKEAAQKPESVPVEAPEIKTEVSTFTFTMSTGKDGVSSYQPHTSVDKTSTKALADSGGASNNPSSVEALVERFSKAKFEPSKTQKSTLSKAATTAEGPPRTASQVSSKEEVHVEPLQQHLQQDTQGKPEGKPNTNTSISNGSEASVRPKVDQNHQGGDVAVRPKVDQNHQGGDMSVRPKVDQNHQGVDMSVRPKVDQNHQGVDMSVRAKNTKVEHKDTTNQHSTPLREGAAPGATSQERFKFTSPWKVNSAPRPEPTMDTQEALRTIAMAEASRRGTDHGGTDARVSHLLGGGQSLTPEHIRAKLRETHGTNAPSNAVTSETIRSRLRESQEHSGVEGTPTGGRERTTLPRDDPEPVGTHTISVDETMKRIEMVKRMRQRLASSGEGQEPHNGADEDVADRYAKTEEKVQREIEQMKDRVIRNEISLIEKSMVHSQEGLSTDGSYLPPARRRASSMDMPRESQPSQGEAEDDVTGEHYYNASRKAELAHTAEKLDYFRHKQDRADDMCNAKIDRLLSGVGQRFNDYQSTVLNNYISPSNSNATLVLHGSDDRRSVRGSDRSGLGRHRRTQSTDRIRYTHRRPGDNEPIFQPTMYTRNPFDSEF